MRAALADAGIAPESIGYINAHGTSTPLGDLSEVRAIKKVFGDHAYKLAVSSTKTPPATSWAPPGAWRRASWPSPSATRSSPHAQPRRAGRGCDLDFVPHHARKVDLEYALTNSFGFGGTNASIAMKRYAG